jgi:glucose/arabinose dehydrogenase
MHVRLLLLAATLGASFYASAQPIPDPEMRIYKSGFSAPLAVRNAGDGSNRLFVVEQGGAIRIIDGAANTLTTNFLTVNSTLSCSWNGASTTPGFTTGGERGLLGLAFHPNYSSNRRFFINFTDVNGDTTIAELQAQAANANLADTSSCRILLRVDQDFANHNGGNLLFGPDGFLYIGMGDGGSGGDPCSRGQALLPANLNNAGSCAVDANFVTAGGNSDSRALLGKMMRIDVNGTTPAAAVGGSRTLCGVPSDQVAFYAIPASNTFGAAGTCSETFAYGLRNPWRFSFDRQTGDLLIGDVGQNAFEEINFHQRGASGLIAGLNYGWNCWEGESAFNGCSTPALSATHDPVMVYPNTGVASVVGGYIYRGTDTRLTGLYIAADTRSDRVFIARPSGLTAPGATQPNWTFNTRATTALGLTTAASAIVSFGEDEFGTLYAAAIGDGTIYVIGSLPIIFRDGFE